MTVFTTSIISRNVVVNHLLRIRYCDDDDDDDDDDDGVESGKGDDRVCGGGGSDSR